jgi:hypothetical protein
MNRRSLMQFSGLATAATLLSGCWLFPAQWNSKLTVTVSTPHGDVSGSAVRWHQFFEDPVLPQGHYEQRGEAVVVEVSSGRFLFVLLDEMKPHDLSVFFPGTPRSGTTYDLAGLKGKKVDITNSAQVPMMVTFANIADPKSVKQVGDLTGAFGAGYSLKSITLEITDEKVTEGVVEKVLPWLIGFTGRILSPDLRLGAGLHDASAVLPIEKLNRSNFVGAQQ